MITDIKKRDSAIEESTRVLEEGKKAAAALIMENGLLRGRLMILA